jgi:hypothetical protein
MKNADDVCEEVNFAQVSEFKKKRERKEKVRESFARA